jgi:hypothetical protein
MNFLFLISLLIIVVIIVIIVLRLTHKKKESYASGDYRKVSEWGNTPTLLYNNGWFLKGPVGSAYCSACEKGKASGCSCNRLSADMSDPYRTRYPIDLPTPFKSYELPGQICPKCLEVIKTELM